MLLTLWFQPTIEEKRLINTLREEIGIVEKIESVMDVLVWCIIEILCRCDVIQSREVVLVVEYFERSIATEN